MTEKIRVTIYIEKEVWGHVQKMAFRASSEEAIKSKSSWIEDLIKADIGNRAPKANFEHKKKELVSHPVPFVEKADAEVLAVGQAKVAALRKEQGIESTTGFTGTYSKDHQTRKKGK